MGDPVSAMAAGTTVLSLASTGLSAYSKVQSAQGTATADEFKAQQLDQQVQYGELKATQVGADLTRNLNIKLGNIDAIRAAGHVDPTSPTGAAVRLDTEDQGNLQRTIQVSNIEEQARTDENSAAYLRQAAGAAMTGGDIAALGTVLGGGAGALKSMGSGSGGFSLNIPGFNPIANVTGQ